MDQLKSSKKETVEQTDEFIMLSTKLLNLVVEHKTKVIGAAVAIMAVFVMVVGIGSYRDSQAEKASEALGAASAAFASIADKSDAAKLKEVAGDFEKVISDYSGSVSAKLARVRVAGIYYMAGDYDSAIKAYKGAAGDFSGNPALESVVNSGLGHAYLKKNDTAEAIASFEKVLAARGKLKKSEALFNLGLLYQAAGDLKKRDEAFSRIVAEFPDSVYTPMVKERTAG